MSLQEAYSLAHTAQCRLQLAASRPDRNLRFVVGHLMHYQSLRLRIVELEHDISRFHGARAVQFHVNDHILQRKPSTGRLRRTSPPPPAEADDHIENVDDENLYDDDDFDYNLRDDGEEDLGLQRFPSGSSRPSQPPPDLEPDDYDDSDEEDDEPVSPGEPDEATMEQAMEGQDDELMVTMYEGVRKCVCHRKCDAPKVERIWELSSAHKEGVGVAGLKARVVAQVA
ncbi:hypothetical protein EJ03DRAFT_180405 [Teratosphaeria nubilosa]|uniref:Uncharacterized protein n=1 Tax=Teratosphaeria nubilosa TaxID=161662 RepID=A0A6G1L0D8_9PEZI|nr:hypothetical protein EJ03DRAFT_180405 [Teratosphaeria nubilosa]